MGQQQLLLLVLGIVIVGLSVVVGIEAFEENNRKSSFDRIAGQAIDYAGKMLEWKMKPRAQGGGQEAAKMSGCSFNNIGVVGGGPIDYHGTNGGDWVQTGPTYVGLFSMDGSGGYAPHVAVYDPNQDLMIAIFVFGNSPDCLVQRMSYMQDGSAVYLPAAAPANPDATNCSL